jgi:putative molybdopterin biosynthesis protein
VRRLFPGRRVALVTLAHRRIGFIVASGNPLSLKGLSDLPRSGVQLVNRQAGSGTRVWLDAQLRRLGIGPQSIQGYADEKLTHSEVAQAIAEGRANVGLGLEAAAQTYGLGFVPLTQERYDLVIQAALMDRLPIQALLHWLKDDLARAGVVQLAGYDVRDMGKVLDIAS